MIGNETKKNPIKFRPHVLREFKKNLWQPVKEGMEENKTGKKEGKKK